MILSRLLPPGRRAQRLAAAFFTTSALLVAVNEFDSHKPTELFKKMGNSITNVLSFATRDKNAPNTH